MKFYKKMAFWQVLIFIITPFTVGGEIAVAVSGGHWGWHVGIGLAGAALASLKYFAEDKNDNGIVDVFEKKPKKDGQV